MNPEAPLSPRHLRPLEIDVAKADADVGKRFRPTTEPIMGDIQPRLPDEPFWGTANLDCQPVRGTAVFRLPDGWVSPPGELLGSCLLVRRTNRQNEKRRSP
jgi:hypothetical protein